MNHHVLGALHGDVDAHKVVQKYEIVPGSGLYADFVVKNGTFRVTAAIDLDVTNVEDKLDEAARKALTLLLAKDHLGTSTSTIAMYNASSEQERAGAAQIRLLERFSDQMFNYSSEKDRAEYFQQMIAIAEHGPQLCLSV